MLSGNVTLPGGRKVPRKALVVAGGAAGGYVLWRYWRAAGSTPAPADQDTTSAGVMDLTGATGAGGSGVAGGSTVGDPMPWSSFGSTYRDPTTTPASTNQDWFTRAMTWAASFGYDADVSSASLGRYLAGETTTGDRTLITSILGAIGKPPEGDYGYPVISPVVSTPPAAGVPAAPAPVTPLPAPAVSTAPKPVAAAPVSTVKNYGWFSTNSVKNTLGTIAQRYGTTMAALKQWNPSLAKYGVNTNLPVGTAVKVRSTATPRYVP